MATATHPYTARILGLLGDKSPLAVLEASPAKFEQHFKRLGTEGLKKSYAPGKWNAAQILCHLADAELAIGFRSRMAVYEPKLGIQAFDQDLWAPTYTKRDPAIAVRSLVAARAWNLSFWRLLGPEELSRVAHHPERGDESVQRILEMLAGHDLNHLAQLEKIK